MEPTPRIFHQFGNSDSMFIRLLQSFCVGQFDLTQWATVLSYLNLGFIYGDIHLLQWVIVLFLAAKGSQYRKWLPCFYGQICTPPEYFCLEALGTICPV